MLGKTYGNVNFLQKALNGTWMRNEAISNNIANVNTPGYKKMTVKFEDMLKGQMTSNQDNVSLKTTNDKHIGNLNTGENFKPSVNIERGTSTRKDGNNVNIDVEMGKLAKNTIMYNGLINQVSREFRQMKSVIEQGGK